MKSCPVIIIGAENDRAHHHGRPYDPRYKDAALKLREILAGVLTAIHHIGSTAVPNQRLISC
ncbi:GrpB family protein [Serratia marcescens]|uniref:GrpB family protein n=1 Tax=Serratia marcescens TaxID=615 RepID=UPI0009303D37